MRIASLDGIRGVSILLVILGHLSLRPDVVKVFRLYDWVGDLGNLGVRIFFVISGFIITHLLIKEYEATGTVSLKKFYIRRSLRIFPAFYFFIIIMFILRKANLIGVSNDTFIRSATYTVNYMSVPERGWYLGHLWSLAVEEQFYLIWPVSFLMLGMRKSVILLICLIFLIPIVRFASWLYFPDSRPIVKWAFHTVSDSLAVGCLLALGRMRMQSVKFYQFLLRMPWTWIVLVVIIFSLNMLIVGRPRLGNLIGITVINLSIGILLDYFITSPPSRIYNFFNGRVLVQIGILSYSLYLWQQFFTITKPTNSLQEWPYNLILLVLTSLFSYFILEKKFLNIKQKWATT
jgi:peptidoglycan/LPS O-acetylase OafA/YrhL